VNVLFLIFNRPDLQKRSFERIRSVKPIRLFIAADGPRSDRDGEVEKCLLARQIAQEVDWPCDVKTLFRDNNVGCRRAVGEAITWFFRNVNEGIIVEDDCVVSESFFNFASSLLNYYRDDHRIWGISGSNYQEGIWRGDGSYYFSRYFHCWGWATWRRCWVNFDDSMSYWDLAFRKNVLDFLFEDPEEREYWTSIGCDLLSSQPSVDTWDYRWMFSVMLNRGLTVIPNRNLVTNIGYGGEGTHCFGKTPDPGIEEFVQSIIHPSFYLPNIDADRKTFLKFFHPGSRANRGNLFHRMKRRIVSQFR
jgi:hypothetical protein